MKKNKLYRVGAAFMAALMVLTCMPQTSLYALADEPESAEAVDAEAGTEAEGLEIGVEPQTDEEDSLQEETDSSSVQTSQESEGEVSPNADDDDPAPIPVTAIALDRSTLTIQREDTAEFRYTLTPNNATEGTTVSFSSSNDEVASYVVNGNVVTVTAKRVGKAYITATTSNGISATCEVEVTPIPVKNVLIDPSDLKMEVGKAEELSVIVVPENADDQRVSLLTNYDSSVITAFYDDTTKKITVTPLKAGSTTLAVKSLSNVHIHGNSDITVVGNEVPVTALSARDGYPKNLYEGSSINLKQYVTFSPVGATDKELTWSVSSGDSDYAEVDQNGRVTAKWKEGDNAAEHKVTVTAASKSKPDIETNPGFEITIKRNNVPLKALHVSPAELVLEDDGNRNYRTISVQLEPLASTDREITAVVSGETGKRAVLINAGSTYNEEVAQENDKNGGMATAEADVYGWVHFTVRANKLADLVQQDTCTITFTKKGEENSSSPSTIKVRCKVTVNKYVSPVDDLKLQDALEIEDGGTANLTAIIEPSNVEDRNIVWTVDDPEIASITGVDKEGRIEATLKGDDELSATVKVTANMVGTCVITATAAGGIEKKCTVTVKEGGNPATGLRITFDGVEMKEITLKLGEQYTLEPVIEPEDADNKTVKWTVSGGSAVASVEKGAGGIGIVTTKAAGDCTITARASGKSPDCTKEVLVHVKTPEMKVNYPEGWHYSPEDQPITAEELKKNLEVLFWPRKKPDPEKDRSILTDYELMILRDDGKTEKIYTPDDMQKAGKKTLVISYTYEGVTYKGTAQVEMKEFVEADLISVTQLSGDDAEIWNVPNGTPANALPLPKTTEILVGRKVTVAGHEELKTAKQNATIKWLAAESGYDPSDQEAQDLTIFGDVVLDPERVRNPNNVSLRVQAEVHVREQASSGKKAVRPSFSVLDGEQIGSRTSVTVPYGSKIVIETVTEEADIYYMVDRRPDEDRGVPQDEEHKYTSPIEITAKTTTIYAIAVKSGFTNSDCSECTIKLVQTQEIDPDDPDAPLPDDVTDEDRAQIGGKVPDGLWAAVQMDADEKREGGFAYTGTAIKPAVHVYDRTMLLTEKIDYTIAYSNNINAGSAKGSAKPPTITVTGKGNYEGKALVYFTIIPQDIEDDSVFMDEYVAVAYNKKAQKPNPSLTWNGKKLTKNKDYAYADESYTEPGVHPITVEGKGNYTGKRTMYYEIFDSGVAVSKLTFSKVPNYMYTGSEIRPTVEVKNKNTVLTPGTEKGSGNYWIKYENCTKVGTASLVIIGKGAYKGSKRINFKILPVAKISQAGITLDVPAAGVAYTGKPYTPKCTVNYLGTELKENKDYKLSYQNNTNTGTATVVITGMGAYTGTAKKTFKILQNDISGLAAVMGTSFVYEKGGCKPKPTVTYNNMKLVEGTDYTLTYKNHNKIGNTASVTVKGKGNYKGQIIRYFEVTMQDISNLKVVATDRVYQQKSNIYKTKVQVIDLNGVALVAGTDYAKDIYYTYESGTKAGQPVLSTDIIPVGTVIRVEVRVANPRCYQGTVHGTYRIVQADVSKAKVSINPQEYTGRSIRPKKSQIQVTVNGVLLGNDDYEIVGYENNIKQGNAKITIRGVGSYGGTKTATFKIQKKGILNLKF